MSTAKWECEVCGEENARSAEYCESCGSNKPKVTARRLKPQRQAPDPTATFVVHPERRDVLFGNRRSMKPTGGFGVYFVVLAMLAGSVALFAAGAATLLDQITLRISGEEIEAVVYEKIPDETAVRYEFNPTLYYQKLHPVSQEFFANTQLDDTVTVIYDPDDPYTSFIMGQATDVIPNGVEIEAVVYEKVPEETAIRYEFQTGIFYQTKQKVSQTFYDATPLGSTVTVLYDPGDAYNNQIKNETSTSPTVYMSLGGVAAFALTLMVSPMLLAGRSKKRALYKEADLIAGTLTGVGTRTDPAGNLRLALEYRFQSPHTGRTYTRRLMVTRNDLKVGGLPEAGDPISILYINDTNHEVV